MATEQIEEYLEAIGRLEEQGLRAATSSLARSLGVSAPSVTEMLGRLSDRGLIVYRPRGEITLTEEGRTLSHSVMRRHRLWERFLHDVLGVRWDSVHDEACKLEHATSPLVESQLAEAVGDSTTCPHGQPIPTPDGEIVHIPSISLAELGPSEIGRVVSVSEEDPAILRQLEAIGIEPGVRVGMDSLDLADGKATLRLEESSPTVSAEVARAVRVSPERGCERVPLSLTQLKEGESAFIDRSAPGHCLGARCLALGFTPGAPVTMVHNQDSGPLVVRVRDTRVALGRGEAQKIAVQRSEQAYD